MQHRCHVAFLNMMTASSIGPVLGQDAGTSLLGFRPIECGISLSAPKSAMLVLLFRLLLSLCNTYSFLFVIVPLMISDFSFAESPWQHAYNCPLSDTVLPSLPFPFTSPSLSLARRHNELHRMKVVSRPTHLCRKVPPYQFKDRLGFNPLGPRVFSSAVLLHFPA